MAYVTLADLQAYLPTAIDPSDNARVATLLADASAMIDDYTGQTWEPVFELRHVPLDGERIVNLPGSLLDLDTVVLYDGLTTRGLTGHRLTRSHPAPRCGHAAACGVQIPGTLTDDVVWQLVWRAGAPARHGHLGRGQRGACGYTYGDADGRVRMVPVARCRLSGRQRDQVGVMGRLLGDVPDAGLGRHHPGGRTETPPAIHAGRWSLCRLTMASTRRRT